MSSDNCLAQKSSEKSFCPIVQSNHHLGEFLETSLFLVVFHIPVCLQSSYFATRHVSVNFD